MHVDCWAWQSGLKVVVGKSKSGMSVKALPCLPWERFEHLSMKQEDTGGLQMRSMINYFCDSNIDSNIVDDAGRLPV